MIELKPPHRLDFPEHDDDSVSFFLAGSIEMGKAEPWQEKVVKHFKDREDIVFFNPRRTDWDASWEQSIHNKKFFEQVTWELDHIESADFVVFYFDPNTQSPITLMELGLVLGSKEDANYTVKVCCPPGYFRRGNVEIICARYDVEVVDTLDELIALIGDNT